MEIQSRATKIHWVVSGVYRQNKKCFLKVVDKRDSQTLLSVVNENLEHGTTVITNMWKGYNLLGQNGVMHKTINHSLNFVCLDDRNIHTQIIENYWVKIKCDMSVSYTHLDVYKRQLSIPHSLEIFGLSF